MSQQSNRIPKGLIASVAVLQLALGLVVAELYLSSHNSLHNNGNWSVSKTEMWNGLIGSYAYLFDLQPLSGGHLNVSAWHGRQEVLLKREVDPVSIEFDYLLTRPDSHFTLLFNRTGNEYTGIRLGRSGRHLPALLTISPEGEFLDKKVLRPLRKAELGEWHGFRVELAESRVSAFLDGREVKKIRRAKTPVERPQRIGFRGGPSPVFIDNLRVVSRDGSEFVETFSRPRNWRRVLAVTLGAALLLPLAAFLLLRRLASIGDKQLLFFFLMFSGVLLICAGALFVLVKRTAGFYPNAGEKLKRQEAYWKDASAEKLFRRIEDRHPQTPAPGIDRFIVLGSSQTAGAGAPTEEETWVRRAERMLNERPSGRRYEWINAAVRGYVLREMVRDFERRWVRWGPATLVVNASHNDRLAPNRFEKQLKGLLGRALSEGMRVVLIQEPNAGRLGSKELVRMHAIMAKVGRQFDVPVLDMQTPLAERGDDGFLWWDGVHMTTFGQRLFAEVLVDQLAARGLVTLAAEAGTELEALSD